MELNVRNSAKQSARTPYKVGKGRPPVATRWKPGQSGNPKGRPKGSENTSTLFGRLLNGKVEITENGKTRKISGRAAIVRTVFIRALRGDQKAVQVVLAIDDDINSRTPPKSIDNLSPAEVQATYLRLVKASPRSGFR
jgi:hypothetical protein